MRALPLRITAIDEPIREVHYLSASPRGRGIDVERLPIALGCARSPACSTAASTSSSSTKARAATPSNPATTRSAPRSSAAVGLTICGHDHWRAPLAAHATGQILNVDTRVVVLVATRAM